MLPSTEGGSLASVRFKNSWFRILTLLISIDAEDGLNTSQIARRTGLSRNTVQVECEGMVKAGLLVVERFGVQNLYSINDDVKEIIVKALEGFSALLEIAGVLEGEFENDNG